MDQLQHWRLRLKLAETCDTEFQSLFAEIMGKTHPGFESVSQNRDGGNDGWVPDRQEGHADYFQVYAPQYHRFSPAEAVKKMQEDAVKLAKHWSPILRVRRYRFVVKCPGEVSRFMHTEMHAVCDKYSFDRGEVLKGETLLETQVRDADPELQKLWVGEPMPTAGRREDAQSIQHFLSELSEPAEKVIRFIGQGVFVTSLRDVDNLSRCIWKPRWSADDNSVAEVQARLLNDCASLASTIRQGIENGAIVIGKHDRDALTAAPYGRSREPAASILGRAGQLADGIRCSFEVLKTFVRAATLFPVRSLTS